MFLTVIPIHRAGWDLTEGLNGYILTSSSTNQQIMCNQTAALAWKLIDGKRSLQAIIDILSQLYPDVENLEVDTEIIVDTFVSRRVTKYIETQ